ncbi:MAG: two-component sensor histidine kinase [Rhodothermales bacterium]|nr:two-component sensor histidine kinase [Rhodothermales bacterium]
MRDTSQILYKKLHADIEEARSALEATNEELKKTQAQLIQQEKLASLGQLTAGIAHEIKNPLNFINNFAEINEEFAIEIREAYAANADVKVADVLEALEALERNAAVIKQHGKRADSIVQSMMQHSSGGTRERQVVDVNSLVSEHVDLAYHGKRATLTDFTCSVVKDLGDDVGDASIVAQDFGRVILNLVGNAFDAVREHLQNSPGDFSPEIVVSTRREGTDLVVLVSDNGPGIDPEVIDKIFEPFFTTKPTGSGTGLGLSLSYDIITKGHGGSLSVESSPATGTTFRIVIPVVE